MPKPLYTSFSSAIQFSVRVSNVTLKDGSRIVAEKLKVISGISKILSCDTSISRPAATIVWYIGLQEKQRSIFKTFSFILKTSDNNKTVYCKAFNTQPENQAITSYKASLFVRERTKFYIGKNESQIAATFKEHDEKIQFTCVYSGKPAEELFIIFNGDIITKQSNTNRLEYNLTDITCTKGSVYTCKGVENIGTSTNKSATLFVECSPRPVKQILHNITGQLGKSVTLSFTVIAYPKPGPNGFTWFMEYRQTWITLLSNNDIQILSTDLGTELTVSNVSREHYGKYRVTCVNKIGTYDQILYFSEKDSRPYTCKSDSERMLFITSISLATACVLITGYATIVTILYKRNRKGKLTHFRCDYKCGTDNLGSTATIEEPHYENNASIIDEEYFKQYTRLQHYSKDNATYEDLNI